MKKYNEKRLQTALDKALSKSVLRATVLKSKARLSLAGAKADNIPPAGRILDFVSSLPIKALSIVLADVQKGLEKPNPTVTEITSLLTAYWSDNLDVSVATWRGAVWFLGCRPVPESLEMLFTASYTLSGSRKNIVSEQSASSTLPSMEIVQSTDAARLDEVIRFLAGDESVVSLAPTYANVAAVVASSIGATALASRLIAVGSADRSSESSIILQSWVTAAKGVALSGATRLAPAAPADAEMPEPSQVTIIGCCVRVLESGERFIDVIGYADAGEFMTITESQARGMFPDSGDVIFYPNVPNLRAPSLGEFGAWTVEKVLQSRKEYATKFRVKSVVRSVYEIVLIPHTSVAIGEIRRWLTSEYRKLAVPRPIFKTSDGVFIRFGGDPVDLITQDAEVQADAWDGLPVYAWRKHFLMLDLAPAPSRRLDFSPIAFVVRDVIRKHQELGALSHLSRRALQEIAHEIRTDEGSQLAMSRSARAVEELQKLSDKADIVNDAVDALMKDASISSEIERRIAIQVTEHNGDLSRMAVELEQLRKTKNSITDDITELKREAKAQSAKVSKAVLKAFEHAKDDGLALLSQSALLDVFLSNRLAAEASVTDSHRIDRLSLPIRMLDDDEIGTLLEGRLTKMNVKNRSARLVSLFVSAAHSSGYLVAFRGSMSVAFAASSGFVSRPGSVCVVDIPPGLIDSTLVSSTLNSCNPRHAIILNGANASLIGTYLGTHIDRLQKKMVSQDHAFQNGFHSIFLTLVEPPLGLAMCLHASSVMAVVDTDRLNVDAIDSSSADFITDVEEMFADLRIRPALWLKKLSAFVTHVENLGEDVAGVFGLTHNFIVKPFFNVLRNSLDEND